MKAWKIYLWKVVGKLMDIGHVRGRNFDDSYAAYCRYALFSGGALRVCCTGSLGERGMSCKKSPQVLKEYMHIYTDASSSLWHVTLSPINVHNTSRHIH